MVVAGDGGEVVADLVAAEGVVRPPLFLAVRGKAVAAFRHQDQIGAVGQDRGETSLPELDYLVDGFLTGAGIAAGGNAADGADDDAVCHRYSPPLRM